MIHVRCYINWAYIVSAVVYLLQQQGLKVELVNEREMFVEGMVSREQVGDLWKVRGLHIMMTLKET